MADMIETIAVDGGRLAYTDRGSGRPIVLLHGGALDHRMWRPQVADLVRDHRVLAVDARGHGRSSTPDAPFRHCDDVAALVTGLDLGRVALVGLSMGAGTAVDVAVEHPDLVDALVVSGTGTSAPDFRDPWLLEVMASWGRAQQAGDADAWLDAFLLLAAGPQRPLADVDPDVVARLRAMAADTLAAHASAGEPVLPTPVPDVAARSPAIAVPVRAVIGAIDSEDHRRMAADLVAAVPHGDAVEIAGTAHYPNLERPAEFTAAVREVLSRR